MDGICRALPILTTDDVAATPSSWKFSATHQATKCCLQAIFADGHQPLEQSTLKFVRLSMLSLEICPVLKWALIFFVIAVVAGIFGFTKISEGAASIAKFLFIGALIVFAIFVFLAVKAGEALF
jgi:uncharacterized membrane protein YtjA (UPF0391 family)